jgi:hypothetical protein
LIKQNARPATAAEITEIAGPLDDAVLVRIVETEATPAEVLEAFTWATADDQIGTELEHRPRGALCLAAGAAALLGSGTELCRRSDVERFYQPN